MTEFSFLGETTPNIFG